MNTLSRVFCLSLIIPVLFKIIQKTLINGTYKCVAIVKPEFDSLGSQLSKCCFRNRILKYGKFLVMTSMMPQSSNAFTLVVRNVSEYLNLSKSVLKGLKTGLPVLQLKILNFKEWEKSSNSINYSTCTTLQQFLYVGMKDVSIKTRCKHPPKYIHYSRWIRTCIFMDV